MHVIQNAMKTTIFFFAMILLLLSSGRLSSQEVQGKNAVTPEESVSIISTPDLVNLTTQWANQYNCIHRKVKINVISTDYQNAVIGISEDLRFISDRTAAGFPDENYWKMVVGHSIVVPFINAENPFINDLKQKGVAPQEFAMIFENPAKRTWGTLVTTSQSAPVNIYVVDDESVKSGLAKFLNQNQIQYAGVTIGTNEEVVSAVQKDPYALGFCKAVSIQGKNSQGLAEQVSLLPIDKNGNGSIDFMEDIYSDMNTFQRGVWIGKYPKTLCSDIYAISKTQPANENELAFLKWVITDGQQFVNASGYSDLVSSESQSQLDKISVAVISAPPVKTAYSLSFFLIILASVLALGLIINAVLRNNKTRKMPVSLLNYPDSTGFDEKSVIVPEGIYFDKTHTWAFMEKNGSVTIGLDDFLQHVTGPITRIEMKNTGERIKKGDLLFSIIQAGKQLSLYAPVSGVITKQNSTLISDTSLLNSSPYDRGWVYMIEPTNWFKEIQLLDIAGRYKDWLNTEFSRMKDFLAATFKPESLEYSHVVLQDGGMLKEGVLSEFGPEVWEDFQTNFLDNSK